MFEKENKTERSDEVTGADNTAKMVSSDNAAKLATYDSPTNLAKAGTFASDEEWKRALLSHIDGVVEQKGERSGMEPPNSRSHVLRIEYLKLPPVGLGKLILSQILLGNVCTYSWARNKPYRTQ